MVDTNVALTPEELAEQLNAEYAAAALPQTEPSPVFCSTGPVKDAALSPAPVEEYRLGVDGVDIKDPVELLFLLDEDLLAGRARLHDWQIRFMMDFANGSHTKESPFQAVVQACNSSGKDKYVIAACAVWAAMRYVECEIPITSSSGQQLDSQTGAHIDRLTNKANAILGPVWKVQDRYYEFGHRGKYGEPLPSCIKLFATDEPGKAEGFHPASAGRKMCIFTSETKSIPEPIIEALERCHGFTHRVDCSSPGIQSGYFYNVCQTAVPRDTLNNIKETTSSQQILYKVTYKDCPHITESEAERMASKLPGGRNNSTFLSSMMAEFGSTDEKVVIPSQYVWKAVKNERWFKQPFNTAGLDLSDGGAETVLSVRNGNKQIAQEAFRFDNSEDMVEYLRQKFNQYDLNHPEALIYGDATGIGKPTLVRLKREGWSNIRLIDSRSSARDPKVYFNRATELFFNTRLLFEKGEIIVMNDRLLITQLCGRYYKISTKNVHQLLTKEEQRSRGYPSPDRADAFNLSFWGYKFPEEEKSAPIPFVIPEDKTKPEITHDFDMREWAKRSLIPSSTRPDPSIETPDMSDIHEAVSDYNRNRLLTTRKY